MSPPQDQTSRAPEVVAESSLLERAATDAMRAADDRKLARPLAEHALALMRRAVAAGEVTWDPEERAELRRVVVLWAGLLERSDEQVELPDIKPFSGHLPSLETIEGNKLLGLIQAKEPVVACRIEAADLRELHGVNGVRIVDCVLVRCDLSGIELSEARLLHTSFEECSFADTTLSDVVATSSIFARGSLGVHAAEGTFCGTRFDGVDMSGGDFRGASFAAATFRDVEAVGATFVEALFDLATVEAVRFDRALISDAIFTGTTVRSVSFRDADLTLSLFSSADVRESSFEGARLDEASFLTAIDVVRAKFDPKAVEVATFSEADAAWLRAHSPA